MVEALMLQTERFASLDFSVDQILPAAGVSSASNRNECQEFSWE
jgi:hypothetical protein